jgi:hypothetical protein
MSIDKWKEQHTEASRVQLKSRDYQEIADQYRCIMNRRYDYLGVFFLALCIIPTYVGLPLPKKNMWQCPKKYFCCEVVGYLTGQDYSMAPPNLVLKSILTSDNKSHG